MRGMYDLITFLNNLLKCMKLTWSYRCQKAFELIKIVFTLELLYSGVNLETEVTEDSSGNVSVFVILQNI